MEVSGFTISCTDFDLLITRLNDSLDLNKTDFYDDERDYLYKINDDSYVLYYESYSLRIGSNLMVSVIMQKIEDHLVKIKIFSGGGKEGLLGISWGSEKSRINHLVEVIIKLIKEYNWSFTEIDDNIKKVVDKHMKK